MNTEKYFLNIGDQMQISKSCHNTKGCTVRTKLYFFIVCIPLRYVIRYFNGEIGFFFLRSNLSFCWQLASKLSVKLYQIYWNEQSLHNIHVTVANRHGRLWVTDYNGPTIWSVIGLFPSRCVRVTNLLNWTVFTQHTCNNCRNLSHIHNGMEAIKFKTCITYTIAVCTVKNSWWWTEELSETCRV